MKNRLWNNRFSASYRCNLSTLLGTNLKMNGLRDILKNEGMKRLFFRHPASEVHSKDNLKIKIDRGDAWEDNRKATDIHLKRTIYIDAISGMVDGSLSKNLRDWYIESTF